MRQGYYAFRYHIPASEEVMMPTQGNSQRPVRIDVSLPALLTTSDNHSMQVRVRDLSAAGCRIDLPSGEELLVGESVTLIVDGNQRLPGQIRWILGNEAGALFL
jgi:hypothetical protein